MEKSLVVKKQIFILKSKDDIHNHYEIEAKVRILCFRRSVKEPTGRYFWVDPKTSPISPEPSK